MFGMNSGQVWLNAMRCSGSDSSGGERVMTEEEKEESARWERALNERATRRLRQHTLRLEELEASPRQVFVMHAVQQSEGVLAIAAITSRSCYTIRWYNLHTRCEIARVTLDEEITGMFAVDARTLIALSLRRKTDPSGRDRWACMLAADVLTSDDGFVTVERAAEVELAGDFEQGVEAVLFALRLQDDIIFGVRYQAREAQADVYRVSLSALLARALDAAAAAAAAFPAAAAAAAAVVFDNASLVGAIGCIGFDSKAEYSSVLRYNSDSIAVLRKSFDKGCRIEIYGVAGFELQRTVPLTGFGGSITFVLSVPAAVDGSPCALVQNSDGQKYRLNLRNGDLEVLPPFATPCPLTRMCSCLGEQDELHARSCIRAGTERTRSVGELAPCKTGDAIRVRFGTLGFIDGALVGDFAPIDLPGETREYPMLHGFDYYTVSDDEPSLTILRTPIDRMHSLATLAADAVAGALSRETRMAITKEANPARVPDFVAAVLRASRNEESQRAVGLAPENDVEEEEGKRGVGLAAADEEESKAALKPIPTLAFAENEGEKGDESESAAKKPRVE